MADQANGLLSPWLRHKRIAATRPYITGGGNVLDYGCGIGALTELCRPDLYLGVDRDIESLEFARSQFPNFRFVQNVPENETFDTIVLLAVIEHIAEPEGFFKRLRLLLTPHGQIVLTTPAPWIEWIHFSGARLGLFSREANAEHEQLLYYASMARIVAQAGLVIHIYKRFLFGANQLFILKHNEMY
jgi:2-polyprenyl-3-methyl-5-hydroxy-6-metoxy-1,4-benzoquinol methylase